MSVPVVELEEVTRTFDGTPPVEALRTVNLTIRRGEFVAVLGPSGSGKSTLLNLLGLLDRPTSGSYRLDGIDTRSLAETERAGLRASRIGFIFQAFHLLESRTIVENVELAELYYSPGFETRAERAVEALEQVGLGHRLGAYPTTLSGGERQRVAIARALIKRPSLILADEPTGNLDTATSQQIMALFSEVHDRGATIVTITHDPNVAAQTDCHYTITDGALR